MKILITGSNGFIGKNLICHLLDNDNFESFEFNRNNSQEELAELVNQAEFICHLAGVNRPEDPDDFDRVNAGFTQELLDIAESTGKKIPVLFTSSVHALADNENNSTNVAVYGRSKRAAEKLLRDYEARTGSPVYIYRLPHVMGKWCKPDYNSVIATFCHNIANDLPIKINDKSTELNIVYIDDLVDSFLAVIEGKLPKQDIYQLEINYLITLGELADSIYKLRNSRQSLVTEKVGAGFMRALNATYLSYLDKNDFKYSLINHADERGSFVEFLKTAESGQFSFFTAKKGVTRGSHYHHTKTEKFLVVQGEATFRFRHIDSGEQHTLKVSSATPEVVETIPGWIHDITNTGESELVVLLWANEIFDHNKPDTFGASVNE
jgi:UDP-2-acetamido-2,6-beta-L-arabino-hexul-4-ose reductase